MAFLLKLQPAILFSQCRILFYKFLAQVDKILHLSVDGPSAIGLHEFSQSSVCHNCEHICPYCEGNRFEIVDLACATKLMAFKTVE